MKRLFFIILSLFLSIFTCVLADDGMVLTTGISVNQIPKTFYGSWRITAKLEQASNYGIFKPQSADMWTLSRVNDPDR